MPRPFHNPLRIRARQGAPLQGSLKFWPFTVCPPGSRQLPYFVFNTKISGAGQSP